MAGMSTEALLIHALQVHPAASSGSKYMLMAKTFATPTSRLSFTIESILDNQHKETDARIEAQVCARSLHNHVPGLLLALFVA
eukprot:1160335-Pelagomonas_calceolata.AAC.1